MASSASPSHRSRQSAGQGYFYMNWRDWQEKKQKIFILTDFFPGSHHDSGFRDVNHCLTSIYDWTGQQLLAVRRKKSSTASACSSLSMEPGRKRRTRAMAFEAVMPFWTK